MDARNINDRLERVNRNVQQVNSVDAAASPGLDERRLEGWGGRAGIRAKNILAFVTFRLYLMRTANQRHSATGQVSEAAFETRSPMMVRKVLSGRIS